MSQFIEMFGNCSERKSLCSICRPKQWPTIPTKDFTEDGYLVYGANGVIGHYTEYNHESPTILMACRGASCGAINISRPKSYITGNAMCLDELSEEVKFEYLAYFLSQYDYKTIITGGAQPQITYTNLKKVDVPIPAIELQCEFVKIVHQADKSEFDGFKSQFIEMFASNDYELLPLGDLCDKISDGSHNPPKGIDNSDYLMISSKNVFKDNLDLSDVRYLTEEDYKEENKRTKISPNDVLLTIVGTIGRTYLVKGDEGNFVMQRSVAVLTPNSKVTPTFLMFYLHTDKDLEKEGRGNAQKGIYLKQLSQYKIKVPPIYAQKQFESIYRQADKSENRSELRMAS